MDSSKIYKIKYTINLLPNIGLHIVTGQDGKKEIVKGSPLLKSVANSEELDIFNTKLIKDYIKFKWEGQGMRHHLVGTIFHFIQIVILIIYVYNVYLENTLCKQAVLDIESAQGAIGSTSVSLVSESISMADLECAENNLAIILVAGSIYPLIYEVMFLRKTGLKVYLSKGKNIQNLAYLIATGLNAFMHIEFSPFWVWSKAIMIVVIMFMILRSFSFMSIFSDFSPIVTMLKNVVFDLQQFMLFYLIIVLIFSMLWTTIGIGNYRLEASNPDFYAAYGSEEVRAEGGYPNVQYEVIGMLAGNIIDVFFTTMGDFNCIGTSIDLPEAETTMFWLSWTVIVLLGNIIFLNFIIAEASASYEKVNERVGEIVEKDKAQFCSEAQEMVPLCLMKPYNFPKYIIVREQDD